MKKEKGEERGSGEGRVRKGSGGEERRGRGGRGVGEGRQMIRDEHEGGVRENDREMSGGRGEGGIAQPTHV